jgi:DNA polymerase-3 subunit delta'
MQSEEHTIQWNFLRQLIESGKIPQAMIFSGQEGLGKKKTAFRFLRSLNCLQKSQKDYPEDYFSCQLIEKGKHPDVLLVEPPNNQRLRLKSEGISISTVRNIQKFLKLKAQFFSFKSVIIDKAETLNIHSQNSLLKTLEEPKGRTIFILLTSNPNLLLETIRSRCQIIRFYPKEFFFKGTEEFKKIEEILKSDIAQRLSFCQSFFKKSDHQKPLNFFLDSFENYLRLSLLKRIGIENKILEGYQVRLPDDFSVLKIKSIIEKLDTLKFLSLNTNANSKLLFENFLINL